jgi:hypothetical protein
MAKGALVTIRDLKTKKALIPVGTLLRIRDIKLQFTS